MRHAPSGPTRIALALGVLLLSGFAALAQTPADDVLHERIRARIHDAAGLDGEQRRQMLHNLDGCLQLDLSDDQLEGLFPMDRQRSRVRAEQMLAAQQQVMQAAHSGMAGDLLADKFREGRMKGAAPEMIDGAMLRMQEHLRTALRQMEQAIDNGITPAGDPASGLHLQRGMALDLWRGLSEGDLDRLREHAMRRAEDGSCTMVDLAAAAETATELIEHGVQRERSRELAGTALEQGYTAREMRELCRMVQSANGDGEPDQQMLRWMEQRMAGGEQPGEIARQMMQQGWLGPRDMHGPGGHSPVDDVIGGPGHPGSGHTGGGHAGGGGTQGPTR